MKSYYRDLFLYFLAIVATVWLALSIQETGVFGILLAASAAVAARHGMRWGILAAAVGIMTSALSAVFIIGQVLDFEATVIYAVWIAAIVVVGRVFALNRTLQAQREEIAALLRQRENTLSEIHHRVRNQLSVLVAILRQDAPPDDAINRAVSRVNVILRNYRLLYETNAHDRVRADLYLNRVAESVIETFEGVSPARFSSSIDPVFVSPQDSIALGIVTNELLTNALKYAGGATHVRNSASPIDLACGLTARSGGEIELTLEDSGPGFPDDDSLGFGSVLIDTYVQQYHGQIRRENSPDGGARVVVGLHMPYAQSDDARDPAPAVTPA